MVRRALVAFLALSAVSCATIAHGTHETIAIDSTPSGASVELKCQELSRTATTPAAITIRRNATDCVATISKPGYVTKTVSFERVPTHQYWLNFSGLAALPLGISDNSPLSLSDDAGLALLFSSVIGLAVDAFDGAMFRHEPGRVGVVLEGDTHE